MSFLSPHSLAPPLSGQQGSLNLGAEAWVDVPFPWLHRRRHAGLEPSPTPASCRQSALAPRPLGSPLLRGATKAQRRPSRSVPAPRSSHLGSSLGCGAASTPPFPGPLAGLQLRAERSRLGSSSSMALLPHYPDVGPSPPRLYRLSAGSARVMRALLITTAELHLH